MYAIIRAGGKQAKVRSGDVIEVDRVKDAGKTIELKPLLIVDTDGKTHSAADLAKAKVTAKVLGDVKGDKIDIFKYKNKSGYRRRQGHRQRFTQLEITGIELGSKKKAASGKKKSEAAPATSSEEE